MARLCYMRECSLFSSPDTPLRLRSLSLRLARCWQLPLFRKHGYGENARRKRSGNSWPWLPVGQSLFIRLFAALFLDEMAQLALHRFERVVNHFVERFVRAVVHLLFFGHELVARSHRHIDAAPVRITFVMSVVRLLNRDVAAIDVVAKFFEPGGVI